MTMTETYVADLQAETALRKGMLALEDNLRSPTVGIHWKHASAAVSERTGGNAIAMETLAHEQRSSQSDWYRVRISTDQGPWIVELTQSSRWAKAHTILSCARVQ